jgi:ribose 5-phosphate isomerase A
VEPIATSRVLQALKALGSEKPTVRSSLPGKAGSTVTDNGGYIIDAPFPPLLLPKDAGAKDVDGKNGVWTVDVLASRLKDIVGVNEIGLFFGQNGYEATNAGTAQKPVAAYFGMEDGSVKVMAREQAAK